MKNFENSAQDEVEEFFDAVSDQMSQSWASAASVLVSSFMTESQPKDRDANDTIAEIQVRDDVKLTFSNTLELLCLDD